MQGFKGSLISKKAISNHCLHNHRISIFDHIESLLKRGRETADEYKYSWDSKY